MARFEFDDLDKAFSYGTIFGAGVALTAVCIKGAINIAKRIKSSKIAAARLYAELDERIAQNEQN